MKALTAHTFCWAITLAAFTTLVLTDHSTFAIIVLALDQFTTFKDKVVAK